MEKTNPRIFGATDSTVKCSYRNKSEAVWLKTTSPLTFKLLVVDRLKYYFALLTYSLKILAKKCQVLIDFLLWLTVSNREIHNVKHQQQEKIFSITEMLPENNDFMNHNSQSYVITKQEKTFLLFNVACL